MIRNQSQNRNQTSSTRSKRKSKPTSHSPVQNGAHSAEAFDQSQRSDSEEESRSKDEGSVYTEHESLKEIKFSEIPLLPEISEIQELTVSPFADDPLNSNTEKVHQIIDYFQLADHYKTNLPSFNHRTFCNNLGANNHSWFKCMVSFMNDAMSKTCSELCPDPGNNVDFSL